MYLSPTEEDRLRVFAAAELARKVLAAGVKLNAPEAVAIVCDAMHLAARAGSPYERVADAGRAAVRPDQLLDGVADLVPEIRLEVLLEEGSRLVVVRHPFGREGSAREPIGAVRSPTATVPGLGPRVTLAVRNRSARPVRVSSHFPFWQANPRLEFDREAARGLRLALPAGASLRWAPGETRQVELVRYGPDPAAGS